MLVTFYTVIIMKLTIELVPSTSFYSNVRSNVSKERWDEIRKQSYEKANYKCEICGDKGKNQGYRHDVECHEIWEYDDENLIQTLLGYISLCPKCHTVKHIGLAQIQGNFDMAVKHLCKVNDISQTEASQIIKDAFDKWKERSKNKYKLNLNNLC
jgi:hypothetical protein